MHARSSLVAALVLLASCGAADDPSPEAAPFVIDGPVTFNEHVAPIIHENCSLCHNDAGSAPFPLLDYHDVSKRSKFITAVTQSRYMPPWVADPDYRHFANERLLDERELALIEAWHEAGVPEGEGAPPATPEFSGNLSPDEPDLAIEMPNDYVIAGDNVEYFITYLVNIELDEPRDLSGLEFVPGNRKMVHHANISFYALDEDADMDAFSGPFVFEEGDDDDRLVARYAEFVDKPLYVDGWVPGKSPTHFKNGMGAKFPKKFVLACQLHYAPTPVEQRDRSSVHVFFHDQPVVTEIFALAIGADKGGVVVPEFKRIEPETKPTFDVSFDVDRSIAVLVVAPHMHLLGDTFKAWATTPNQDEVPIISIPEWDFSWQENYLLERPLRIPRGSRIRMRASFDNTSSNPSNPFDPPRPIECEGDRMETDNEMLVMTLVYYPLPF